MIGVFVGDERIGTIVHFEKDRYWVAYGPGEVREAFKTRKAAGAWLVELHEASAHSSTEGGSR